MRQRGIRVLVVDDHEVVRAGIISLLQREPDLDVVGDAESGEEALIRLEELRPDVVILDYRLPNMTGAAACRQILRRRPSTSVIMLTSAASDEMIDACLIAGARAFLTKDFSADLAEAIRSVSRGEAVLAPQATERILTLARAGANVQDANSLSSFEVEILSLVAQGLSNKQIGKKLCKSEGTVKVYLNAIMRKLDVRRRYEAVAVGMERGVI
jgi:DNA-binding NarL/FixJ family response regulator